MMRKFSLGRLICIILHSNNNNIIGHDITIAMCVYLVFLYTKLKAKQPRANSIPATASRSMTTARGVSTVSMIIFGTPSYGISPSADQY